MNFLLQLRADPLRAAHGRLQVPPLPPLPRDGDGHQDGVDGHGGGGGEESDAGQGGDEESQGVGHGTLSLGWNTVESQSVSQSVLVTLGQDNGSSPPRESLMSIKRNPMIYVFNMNVIYLHPWFEGNRLLKVDGTHLFLSSYGWDISAVHDDHDDNPRSETEVGEIWD